MELAIYLHILRRRLRLIIFIAALTAGLAAAGAQLLPTRYSASATLRVGTGDGRQVGWDDMQYADRVMNTLIEIAESRPVGAQLAQQLGLSASPEVSAKILANTELIELTAVAKDPGVARDAANLLAEMMIMQSWETGQRINRLTLIEPAILPRRSSTPAPALIGALGLIVGLAGGVTLAFIFANLDSRLYMAAQIEEASGLKLLGAIPATRRRRVASIGRANTAQHEAFRHLRTNILVQRQESRQHVIIVTSARPKEGKSTVVAHLADSIAQLGLRVLAVDADMRLPTLHRILGLPNSAGLSDVLEGRAALDDVLQESARPGLAVLAAGPQPVNPPELLSSPQMKSLLGELRQRFDVVLLDTPALLAVTDAAALAPDVDAVLLVVARGQTSLADLEQARQQLGNVFARLIGAVMNRAEMDRSLAYYTRASARYNRTMRQNREERVMH